MSEKIQKTSRDTNDHPDYPSLNIVAELTKERVVDQLEQVKILDGKANFVLGAATALVSASLILQAGLLSTQSTPSSSKNTSSLHSSSFALTTSNLFHLLPLALLILPYLAVMISAFLAYRIRVYKQTPDPERLYENYLQKDEQETKAAVYRATLEAYKANVKTINRKVRCLNIAFVFLTIETILLAITLVLQILL